jgi:hypothetical protein
MIISIDIRKGTASIDEQDNLTAFHVRSSTKDESLVAAAVEDLAIPGDDSHVWVSTEWVIANTPESISDEWEESFLGMVEYAAAKGWVNQEGTHLKARIEIDDEVN